MRSGVAATYKRGGSFIRLILVFELLSETPSYYDYNLNIVVSLYISHTKTKLIITVVFEFGRCHLNIVKLRHNRLIMIVDVKIYRWFSLTNLAR